MLFGVGAPEQKFWATARMSASYFRHFFLKKFWCVWTRTNFYIEISRPVEYSTSPIWGGPTNENTQKIDFFKIT